MSQTLQLVDFDETRKFFVRIGAEAQIQRFQRFQSKDGRQTLDVLTVNGQRTQTVEVFEQINQIKVKVNFAHIQFGQAVGDRTFGQIEKRIGTQVTVKVNGRQFGHVREHFRLGKVKVTVQVEVDGGQVGKAAEDLFQLRRLVRSKFNTSHSGGIQTRPKFIHRNQIVVQSNLFQPVSIVAKQFEQPVR